MGAKKRIYADEFARELDRLELEQSEHPLKKDLSEEVLKFIEEARGRRIHWRRIREFIRQKWDIDLCENTARKYLRERRKAKGSDNGSRG